MLNPAHILETAFLLLAAFLIGAVIGSLAKLLVLRLTAARPASAATAEIVAAGAAVEAQPALVAAPVIEPVSKPAQPAAPAEVPVPDFTEAAKSLEALRAEVSTLSEVRMPKIGAFASIETGKPVTMAPAREAGKTTAGKQVPSPKVTDDVVAAPAVATGPSADVIPFPVERGAPAAEVVVEPEAAKATDIEVVDEAQVPVAAVAQPIEQDLPEITEPAVAAPVAVPQELPVAEAVASEPASVVEVVKAPVAEETRTNDQASVPHEDETAAMRAIEGTSTPRRNAVRRTTKVPAPEGIAVDEETTTAAEPPGKPPGLAAPRGGVKDNLTNVIGILPVIETSLNSIGVYHFDQVAAFNDENVAWLEAHLGIGGRIDREHWREQARELAVVSDRARKVAGQQ